MINISDSAYNKIKQLKDSEDDQSLKLRIYITGGGCSGFSYGFKFDTTSTDNDVIIEKQDEKILVDSLSMQYLSGSSLDYEEGLQGARFVVNNPNAQTTCGCGSSFSI